MVLSSISPFEAVRSPHARIHSSPNVFLDRIGPVPKSPLSSKGFHTKHSRVLLDSIPNTSARRHLKGKQPALPTIVEEEEEEYFVPPKPDLRRELDILDDHKDTADDEMDWDEETTLVAMLRDEYVPLHIGRI